jgi:hypothetical protein
LRQYVSEPAWRITRVVSGAYPAATSFLTVMKHGVVDTQHSATAELALRDALDIGPGK